MYPSSSEGLNRETSEAVYFFTPVFYPLDNFSAHSVHIWGVTFPTAEHAYQWKKFNFYYPEIAKNILAAKSPDAAKKISDQNESKVYSGWHTEKVGFMEQILKAKAAQHEDVREVLVRTGNRTIVENSPEDGFWGAVPDSKGENMVGKLWMKIRDGLLQ